MISQTSFHTLPAVVIGGPPHSGKSVLAYSLTCALREREVPHYLLRAYPPDYEGDWFLAGEPETVRHLRFKGTQSACWLPLLQRDLAARHLPLLVDVGGLPTPEQEQLLETATHGILLTPDAASHAVWAARFARYGLALIADLHSDLHGSNALTAETPVLRGTLAGLARGTRATGPAFTALVERLVALFTATTEGLVRHHLAAAPAELAVELAALARQLGQDAGHWLPEALPAVLDYLPEQTPLALYGRGPNWLYAATAAHALPAPFYLFDVRWGWIAAPPLEGSMATAASGLTVVKQQRGTVCTLLDFRLQHAYLDLTQACTLAVPPVQTAGLILQGKLPHWLWAALARHYAAPTWVAVVQPQLDGAIVVRSRSVELPVGSRLTF